METIIAKTITTTLTSTTWNGLGAIFSAGENLPTIPGTKKYNSEHTGPYIYPTKIDHEGNYPSFEITINIDIGAPVELVERLLKLLFPESYPTPAQTESAIGGKM